MEVGKMKFKRHKVTKDDWLVVLVGILLGVILIWFSSVFGLDLIKRVWSSFLIIYCFGSLSKRTDAKILIIIYYYF